MSAIRPSAILGRPSPEKERQAKSGGEAYRHPDRRQPDERVPQPAFFFLICFYVYPTVFNIANSLTDLSLFGLTSRTIRKYRLQTVCRVLLLVPWATPPIVAILVWRWVLDTRVGVINGLLTGLGVVGHPIPFLASAAWVWPALITIITWNTLPLVTLTFIASLQSLPSELVDAAEVDGATRLQVVRYIYLPHLKPAIVVMGLMSTFWTFNNFIYVWLTTGAGPGLFTDVLATEVYIKAFIDGRLGYSSAVGVVMAAIMVVFGLIYLRLIVEREFGEAY